MRNRLELAGDRIVEESTIPETRVGQFENQFRDTKLPWVKFMASLKNEN